MSNLSRLIFIVITILLMASVLVESSTAYEASEYPSIYNWPTFAGSSKRNGFTCSFVPVDNKLIWECPTGSSFQASPIFAYGKVYAVTKDGVVYCVNLRNGSVIWSTNLGDPCNSTPTYFDDRLYVSTVNGKVYCLNCTDGSIIWENSLGKPFHSSPLAIDIRDCVVIIVTSKNGWIYVLNDSNGGSVVKSRYLNGNIVGSPSAVSRKVYVGLEVLGEAIQEGKVVCLDAVTLGEYWNVTVEDPVWSSIAISNNRIYFTSLRGAVYCLNASRGNLIWSTLLHVSACYSTPAIGYSRLYVSVGNRVYCLNATTGEVAWYLEVSYRIFSSVALGGNGLGVFTSNGSIVYCFDIYSGDIKWIFPIPRNTGNFISSPLITNSTVIVTASNGVIYRIGSKAPPFILSIETVPIIPVYDVSTEINAIVVDHARGVLNVTLHYWDNFTEKWHIVPMSLIDGDLHNGSWSALIPVFKYGTHVKFYVNACSVSGLFTVSNIKEFTISDIYPPEISNVTLSPQNPSYESNVTVTATVTEPENSSGIASVTLVYLENSSGKVLVHKYSMKNLGGDQWLGVIGVYPWMTYVSFYIVASDNAGNMATSPTYDYIVADPDPPLVISLSVEPSEPNVGDTVEVYATIADNGSGVYAVTLFYDYGTGHDEVPMKLYMGDIHYGTWRAVIPSDINKYQTRVRLLITAIDKAGNEALSAPKTYIVGDDIPPKILRVQIEPPRPQYCDNVTVVAQVHDYESGIFYVLLKYFTSEENPIVIEMDRVSENVFIATIPAFPYATHVYYQIIAVDNAGNNVTSPIYMYIVEDFTPPEIKSVSYDPPSPLPNEEVEVTVTVSDRGSGVKIVILKYFESRTWHELVMQRVSGDPYQGVYVEKIGNLKAGSFVKFMIIVRDYAGNNVTSITYTFTVRSRPIPFTLIFEICLAVVVAIAVIALILTRRKRPPAPKTPPPPPPPPPPEAEAPPPPPPEEELEEIEELEKMYFEEVEEERER